LQLSILQPRLQRDPNPADAIDQAIIVPIPDDDRDVDTALF